MSLLAIDPGLRGVGLAYFNDAGILEYANYVANPKAGDGPNAWFALGDAVFFDMKNRGYRVDVYVCEYPQVYGSQRRPGGRLRGADPNDLIQITGVAAACGVSFPLERAVGYKPREWKGTIAKEKHHPRILFQLSPEELLRIHEKRKTYEHNVIDAIGLGLYELERMRVRLSK